MNNLQYHMKLAYQQAYNEESQKLAVFGTIQDPSLAARAQRMSQAIRAEEGAKDYYKRDVVGAGLLGAGIGAGTLALGTLGWSVLR